MPVHDQKLHNLNQALGSARAKRNQQRVNDLLRLIQARHEYLAAQSVSRECASGIAPATRMYV